MTTDSLLWCTALTGLLGAACVTDLRSRRIPNHLVLATLALALARAAFAPATPPFAAGIGPALLGAALGLAAWTPLYALGVLGAGDVKLFAAAAAWLGPHAMLPASLYAALAGGVLGIAWLTAGTVRRSAPALTDPATVDRPRARGGRRLPYAPAIAAGTLAVVWGATW